MQDGPSSMSTTQWEFFDTAQKHLWNCRSIISQLRIKLFFVFSCNPERRPPSFWRNTSRNLAMRPMLVILFWDALKLTEKLKLLNNWDEDSIRAWDMQPSARWDDVRTLKRTRLSNEGLFTRRTHRVKSLGAEANRNKSVWISTRTFSVSFISQMCGLVPVSTELSCSCSVMLNNSSHRSFLYWAPWRPPALVYKTANMSSPVDAFN